VERYEAANYEAANYEAANYEAANYEGRIACCTLVLVYGNLRIN